MVSLKDDIVMCWKKSTQVEVIQVCHWLVRWAVGEVLMLLEELKGLAEIFWETSLSSIQLCSTK